MQVHQHATVILRKEHAGAVGSEGCTLILGYTIV